jgi:hypothetical protein
MPWAALSGAGLFRVLTLPDQDSVTVYSPNSMQRDGVGFSVVINQLEIKMIVPVKAQCSQRNIDNSILDTVMVSDYEFRLAEFSIPLDPVQ